MGCCGCDNRASANTAGIFAIIQCIVGFSLAINYLNIFNGSCSVYSTKGLFCDVLYNQSTTIKALLIVAIVMYILWLISSIILLVGNAQNKAGYVRQWVGFSTVVIVCDVVFPIIIAVAATGAIMDQINRDSLSYTSLRQINYNDYGTSGALAWNYIGLLLTFSRGGLITWCCDIALTVFVSRRATEITNPPATYVYTQAFPTATVVTANYPPQYIQNGLVLPQQGYVVQPQAQQYYQHQQFNQPQQFIQQQQFNQPQQFNQHQAYSQPDASNNVGPPPEYSSGQNKN